MTIYLHDNVKIHFSNILSNICTQLSCLDSKDSTNVNFSLKQIKFLDAELTRQCLSIPYQCAWSTVNYHIIYQVQYDSLYLSFLWVYFRMEIILTKTTGFYILTDLVSIKLNKLFPFQTLKRLNFSIVFVDFFYYWLKCKHKYVFLLQWHWFYEFQIYLNIVYI